MSELPMGWYSCSLEGLFEFVLGGDWGKDESFDDPEFTLVYCIRGSEFKNWIKDKGKTASLRKIKKASLEKRQLREGDILIEISGGGPDQPVGRTVLIDKDAMNQNVELPKVCTNFLRLARPSSVLDSRYLNYFLSDFYLSGEVVKYQGGSNNLRNLKFKDYCKIDVSLAPTNEQTRIANKLDSLLAKVEETQSRLEKIPGILKRFRQSVLAAATRGELTKEWRETNVGYEYKIDYVDLARKERSSRGLKETKHTKLALVEVTPYDIPKSWKWFRLGSLALKITDGAHNTPKVLETGYPYLMAKDLTKGSLDFSENRFISEREHRELYLKCSPEIGDLLIVNIGAGTGNNVTIDVDFEFSFKNIAIVKRPSFMDSRYLKHFFDAQKSYIFEKRTKGGAQPFLSLTALNDVAIALPPEPEQGEIVRRVESLFDLADKVEKQYQTAKQRTDRLTQSLLAKAFRGELVPQDPNDEPASELLKRIQTEREAVAKTKSKRTKRVSKKKSNTQLDIELAPQERNPFLAWLDERESAYATETVRLLSGSERFSIDQLKNLLNFKGDEKSFQTLILKFLKGHIGQHDPLLELVDWEEASGDYALKVTDGAKKLI